MFNRKYLGLSALVAMLIIALVSCASMAGAKTVTTHRGQKLVVPHMHKVGPTRLNKCDLITVYGEPYGNGVYDQYKCLHQGMRIQILQADNADERAELPWLASVVLYDGWPQAYCSASGGYAINAAWQGDPFLRNTRPTRNEIAHYATWLQQYSAANHCTYYGK